MDNQSCFRVFQKFYVEKNQSDLKKLNNSRCYVRYIVLIKIFEYFIILFISSDEKWGREWNYDEKFSWSHKIILSSKFASLSLYRRGRCSEFLPSSIYVHCTKTCNKFTVFEAITEHPSVKKNQNNYSNLFNCFQEKKGRKKE